MFDLIFSIFSLFGSFSSIKTIFIKKNYTSHFRTTLICTHIYIHTKIFDNIFATMRYRKKTIKYLLVLIDISSVLVDFYKSTEIIKRNYTKNFSVKFNLDLYSSQKETKNKNGHTKTPPQQESKLLKKCTRVNGTKNQVKNIKRFKI